MEKVEERRGSRAAQTKVPAWFAAAFDGVVKHLGLSPEEVEEAKAAVRGDLDNALVSYRLMYENITRTVPYTGTMPTVRRDELDEEWAWS